MFVGAKGLRRNAPTEKPGEAYLKRSETPSATAACGHRLRQYPLLRSEQHRVPRIERPDLARPTSTTTYRTRPNAPQDDHNTARSLPPPRRTGPGARRGTLSSRRCRSPRRSCGSTSPSRPPGTRRATIIHVESIDICLRCVVSMPIFVPTKKHWCRYDVHYIYLNIHAFS